jgi:hypothetical protein
LSTVVHYEHGLDLDLDPLSDFLLDPDRQKKTECNTAGKPMAPTLKRIFVPSGEKPIFTVPVLVMDTFLP